MALYAISGERTIADFYRLLEPVQEVMMSQWGRDRCPSASSLSRFLGCVEVGAVEALRCLFESDMQRNSVRVKQELGVFDRVSDHSVVFDIDGTVCAVRQRSITTDVRNDPPAVRRSEGVCAPFELVGEKQAKYAKRGAGAMESHFARSGNKTAKRIRTIE